MHFNRLAQEEEFHKEICTLKSRRELPGGSKLLPLKPILDEEEILRCDGRLGCVDCLPWETCYPIILPRSHWITKLIIKDSHEMNQHGGTNQVLAQLSSRYRIVSAREAFKGWEKECMLCRRRKVTPEKQIMAPLYQSFKLGSHYVPSVRTLLTSVEHSIPRREEGRPIRRDTCLCSPVLLQEQCTWK